LAAPQPVIGENGYRGIGELLRIGAMKPSQ
jgi:hypothetical protein